MRLVLALLLAFLVAPASAVAAEVVPGRVVVGFASGTDARERADVRADADATLLSTVSGPEEQVLRIDGDPQAVAAALERRPEVAFAEPDYRVRAQWMPNDAMLNQQWGLAQTSTPRAWDGGARGAGVLVGVVDTGVAFGHPDLGRLQAGGFDFANRDSDPSDDNGHGTSVTGVIAATANNGIGVAGVAPEASIVAAKALAANGSGYTSDVADGVHFLADRNARVINLSLGGPDRSQILTSAIEGHPGTLFVVAAGNANADNDAGTGTWPCNEPAANVICVGASTQSESRAGFSNYGAASVDLMAPGQSIETTVLNGYGLASGTSFSAPMVAGAAALLYGQRPTATVADVRSALLSSTDAFASYHCLATTGGRLNVERALLTLASGSAPAVVAPPVCNRASAPVALAPAPAPDPAPSPAAPAVTPQPPQKPSGKPASCTVPELKRITPTRARQRLQMAGCKIGTVRRQYSKSVRQGRVVTSSPRPGEGARAVVSLLVSRGRR
ncbi:MAG: S8 family serine peptidase [Solirubrobacterales bacterium]|nr:S8 family serine peptidase [Solirubrobacterales bacterium]